MQHFRYLHVTAFQPRHINSFQFGRRNPRIGKFDSEVRIKKTGQPLGNKWTVEHTFLTQIHFQILALQITYRVENHAAPVQHIIHSQQLAVKISYIIEMYPWRGEHVSLLHLRGKITPVLLIRNPIILQRIQMSLTPFGLNQGIRDQQVIIRRNNPSPHVNHLESGFLPETQPGNRGLVTSLLREPDSGNHHV